MAALTNSIILINHNIKGPVKVISIGKETQLHSSSSAGNLYCTFSEAAQEVTIEVSTLLSKYYLFTKSKINPMRLTNAQLIFSKTRINAKIYYSLPKPMPRCSFIATTRNINSLHHQCTLATMFIIYIAITYWAPFKPGISTIKDMGSRCEVRHKLYVPS